ncbi:MAG: FMN-binding protein, partial [Clostridia bacterium]|nr:FMN-binding protein [Clostridia bacterium]
MVKNIKSVGVLVVICTVVALLLAVTNQFTAPIIEKNQSAAANQALLEVMSDGTGFEEIDLGSYNLPASVTKAYKETAGKGYVIELSATGYGPNMVIMCGVSADGKVTGAVCLSSNETLGKEKDYGANFAGKDAAAVEATDTISGATMTTGAYKNAIKDALVAAINLSGGNAETRTPEQILQDNLAEALPAGEGKFTKMFFTEQVEGVDAAYSADNGAGFVAIIGEEFVTVNSDGSSSNAVASTAVKALIASTSTP